MRNGKNPKVLILRDEPPPVGGVRVSAAQTSALLREIGGINFEDVKFDSHPGTFLEAFTEYFKRLRSADAVLFQIGDFLSLSRKRALAFIAGARFFRKPIIFRGFAGGIKQGYESLGSIQRFVLARAARTAHVITFQTRADVDYFSRLLCGGARVRWLPNTRASGVIRARQADRARRFCFFGKVCRAKGVHTILDAHEGLPEAISIDIYGELVGGGEGRDLEARFGKGPVRYCGAIPPEEIPSRLTEYDCLLLPTTWKTEGYPGVILEAFAAGIPVICTRWNALPELVDESCGILVDPESPTGLREAMLAMYSDEKMWRRMARGASARIAEFDPYNWAGELHGWISEVVREGSGPSELRIERVEKET